MLLWDGRGRDNDGEAIIDRAPSHATGNPSVLYLKNSSATTGELHVLDIEVDAP